MIFKILILLILTLQQTLYGDMQSLKKECGPIFDSLFDQNNQDINISKVTRCSIMGADLMSKDKPEDSAFLYLVAGRYEYLIQTYESAVDEESIFYLVVMYSYLMTDSNKAYKMMRNYINVKDARDREIQDMTRILLVTRPQAKKKIQKMKKIWDDSYEPITKMNRLTNLAQDYYYDRNSSKSLEQKHIDLDEILTNYEHLTYKNIKFIYAHKSLITRVYDAKIKFHRSKKEYEKVLFFYEKYFKFTTEDLLELQKEKINNYRQALSVAKKTKVKKYEQKYVALLLNQYGINYADMQTKKIKNYSDKDYDSLRMLYLMQDIYAEKGSYIKRFIKNQKNKITDMKVSQYFKIIKIVYEDAKYIKKMRIFKEFDKDAVEYALKENIGALQRVLDDMFIRIINYGSLNNAISYMQYTEENYSYDNTMFVNTIFDARACIKQYGNKESVNILEKLDAIQMRDDKLKYIKSLDGLELFKRKEHGEKTLGELMLLEYLMGMIRNRLRYELNISSSGYSNLI